MQGSTRPAHSQLHYCNWKIVSNVDDELGMAVVVCIYIYIHMPPISKYSFKFVHNHCISSLGALVSHECFKLEILVQRNILYP